MHLKPAENTAFYTHHGTILLRPSTAYDWLAAVPLQTFIGQICEWIKPLRIREKNRNSATSFIHSFIKYLCRQYSRHHAHSSEQNRQKPLVLWRAGPKINKHRIHHFTQRLWIKKQKWGDGKEGPLLFHNQRLAVFLPPSHFISFSFFLFLWQVSLCGPSWLWTYYITQVGLEPSVPLPQFPVCWDYRHTLLCSAKEGFAKSGSIYPES